MGGNAELEKDRRPGAKEDKLLRMVADLERRLESLNSEVRSLRLTSESTGADAAGAQVSANTLGIGDEPPKSGGAARGRPVRALVLDALEDLGWCAYSRELALYIRARVGREIPPERFGTLGVDEVRAYRNASKPRTGKTRPVWLCFAVTHSRHEAIRRLWARSDWPLEHRIVAPTTGRIQHLKMTARLCQIALRAEEVAADPEMMRIIAADHARDLPGVRVQRGTFELQAWRDKAASALAELEHDDGEARLESADRLRKRPLFFQLFGLPDIIDGSDMTDTPTQLIKGETP